MSTTQSQERAQDFKPEDFDVISTRSRIVVSEDEIAAVAQKGDQHYIVVQNMDSREIVAVKEKPEDFEVGNLQEVGQEMIAFNEEDQ